MVSKPFPTISAAGRRASDAPSSFWARFVIVSLGVFFAGWLWPYEVRDIPANLASTSWILGWFTVLVLIGAAGGYLLRSRLTILVVPLGLYFGGVVHWMQFEWGLQAPPWTLFLLISGLAFGVLLITAGVSAGIAARVVAEEAEEGSPSDGIRLSAALAALLGLLAVTVNNVLPVQYLGALLGLAAILAGLGLMEQDKVNLRERLLAIVGMLIGVVAVGTQLMSLWSVIKNL